MLTLYIIRHAKSSWTDMALRDFDRPLNDRGHHDAPLMGKRLKARKIHPDLMITSPALRALSTGKEISDALGFPADQIRSDKKLYHADASQLLVVLKELSNARSVMIFGHNPGLTEFANRLLDLDIDNIPTCGIVAAALNIQTWSEISWGCGELIFFDYPKLRA